MIPVLWYLNDGFWDTALPKYIIGKATDETQVNLVIERGTVELAPEFPFKEKAIIVVPGRHSTGDYGELNQLADKFEKVIFMIIGDEEGIFNSSLLDHENKKSRLWWFMPPLKLGGIPADRVAPNGWPTHAPQMIAAAAGHPPASRRWDWSFYGQLTHQRRQMCVDGTGGIPNGKLLVTPGFTQGVSREDYYHVMVRSKIVLCPAGPCTPDSFRLAEALEAGCIPIADGLTQNPAYPPGYWPFVFNEPTVPFPVVENWAILDEVIDLYLRDWQKRSKYIQGWWEAQKLKWVIWLREDLDL